MELKYTATSEDTSLKVKSVLRREFGFSSRFMTKVKFQDLMTINGEKMPLWVSPKEGDQIVITLPDEHSDFPEEDIAIYPVYEDEHILVLNKQPYVIVHPTKGHPIHTIANGLMKYMRQSGQDFKVRFVNRLDMDTSGLLIVAKHGYAQDRLSEQMKAGKIRKEYQAIVQGLVEQDEGTIDIPIGRPSMDDVRRGVLPLEAGGQRAITHYQVLDRFPRGKKKDYTLVQLKLETGRTHQIRVHMSTLGHPILGDELYGGENPNLIARQALHAFKLQFNHPVSGEPITIEAPLPKDIQGALDKLRAEK
ncbi:MAG: RluA family pseudouridine synthase [Clostridia bacterium]|nr:RluA family pseudouridine synthase [Clostridia bacterium]